MRYFNWKLAIVLVVAAAVFVVAALSLHRWQRSTRAEQALPRGLKAYELKKWDEAADQLGRYLSLNNQDVAVLIKYADAQLNRRPNTVGNLQQAITAYRTVVRLRPDDLDTTKRFTELYLRVGNWDEAKQTAQRYLERRDDPTLRCLLAAALWQLRDFNQATAELKQVIEKHPAEIPAYESIGRMAEARPEATGKPAGAWFDEAVSKNPDSALAYAARAAYRLRSNDHGQAVADLTHAAACDLSDTSVRLRVTREFMAAGKWEEAREQLRALQAASPGEPGLWFTWADLATKAGSPEEKYQVAEEGISALGTQAWDFMLVATQLLIVSGHLEKVEEYLSQMRNKEIDPMQVAYLDGLLAEKQGNLGEAVRHWQQAVANAEADRLKRIPVEAYIRLATTIARLGDTQSAIGQLQALLSKAPDIVSAQLFLTQLYAHAGDWQKVLDQAGRVQQNARNYPGVMAEAQLLELRARTQLLAAGGAADANQPAWGDIETRLAELDKTTDGALPVKLLQIQIAMTRQKIAEAAAMLSELESKYPADVRVMLIRAEFCLARGEETDAKKSFQNAIAKFPQAVEPVRGLAFFLDRQNQRQECEVTIKEAFLRIQDPQLRLELGLLLARFYGQWQENEKLYRWLTDLTPQFPHDIQSRRLLLVCDPMVQDPARSQAIVDEIKTLEGDNGTQWRYEQSRLWIRGKEFQEAAKSSPGSALKLRDQPVYRQVVKLLQENLSIYADDSVSRLLLAGVYEAAGEQQLALTTYREAYNRSPEDTQVLVRFVAALHRAGQFDEAQSILKKLGQQDLVNPDLQRLQVNSDVRSGDLVSASDTLQQLVERDPNDVMLKLWYARVLSLRKQFPEAQAILTDLRAKDPNSIAVAQAQIRLCLQQGDTTQAMGFCDELVKKLHNAAAHMLRADVYITLKENDKALQDLGQAITLEPQKPDTWEARARTYGLLGRVPEAISDVRRALALAPEEPRIQKFAAMLFITSGKQTLLREAEDMLDKALGSRTDSQEKIDPELGVLKARILMLRSTGPTIEQARGLLRQITSDRPTDVEAWELMAQLELQQEEPGRALDIATKGLAHNEKNKQLLLLKAIAEKRLSPSVAALTTLPMLAKDYPDDVGILIEWADAYARADRPEKAVELLDQKLADFSGTARRRCEIALAAALYTNEQREKAKTLFETLIAAEPNDPTPVMTLGQLLRKEKRWTEVNQLVNLWRNTNPKDAETATNMARILAGSGDKEALQMAEDQLRMILDPNPESVPTLVLLGMLMQDAGRNAEATRLNRRILELDPNNVIAINNLAWMLCEDPASSPEAIKEALSLANRGLAIVPEYMDLLDTRGVVHYRLGDMAKAEADFVKCLGLFPANASQSAAPQFHLARTYADMNRRTQAVEHLKEALNMNGKNVQLAREHADAARITHAMKVLKDALTLQEQMDKFKTGFDQQDLIGSSRSAIDWTQARLLLEQLQKGR